MFREQKASVAAEATACVSGGLGQAFGQALQSREVLGDSRNAIKKFATPFQAQFDLGQHGRPVAAKVPRCLSSGHRGRTTEEAPSSSLVPGLLAGVSAGCPVAASHACPAQGSLMLQKMSWLCLFCCSARGAAGCGTQAPGSGLVI